MGDGPMYAALKTMVWFGLALTLAGGGAAEAKHAKRNAPTRPEPPEATRPQLPRNLANPTDAQHPNVVPIDTTGNYGAR